MGERCCGVRVLPVFLHDFAVLQREIQQHADELIAASAGLFGNVVNLIDDLLADADGERLVAVCPARVLHRDFEFLCHRYHLMSFIITKSVNREYDYINDIVDVRKPVLEYV